MKSEFKKWLFPGLLAFAIVGYFYNKNDITSYMKTNCLAQNNNQVCDCVVNVTMSGASSASFIPIVGSFFRNDEAFDQASKRAWQVCK